MTVNILGRRAVRPAGRGLRPRWLALVAAGASAAVALGSVSLAGLASAAQAPVGNGFVVTAGDLSFILKQIKIAERHAATATAAVPCDTLVGPDVDQIPDRLSSYGLRTVDGSCNNLFAGREKFAAADVPFPRLVSPSFRDAEPITQAFPVGPLGGTSYKQKLAGNVVIDSQPRLISNLIVDQTSTNPAAVAAAGNPVRTQGNTGLVPCTTDPDPTANPPVVGVPAGCVPSHKTLFIPNVTTDVGLSPPFNSLFTFFGQFFDHGVDQTVKGGGTVFVPLHDDDPLITLGPDGKAGTGDEVQPQNAFMVLTRGQNQPGPDGVLGTADDIQDANNTDSPWVDQSQTYTSHPSHQVFLREYAMIAGRPFSTGKLLGGLPAGQTYLNSPNGTDGISTWASVKRQAATKLGLLLTDQDVTNIPLLATDPYGNFKPGPNGLPQYVTASGLVEGNLANPVPVPGNALHFDTPFLTDIAHNADPSPVDTDHDPTTPPVAPTPDLDNTPSANFAAQPAGTYDDEMLDAHFACGDGRCNENIALSTIHQIFHSEHDRLVDDITATLNANPDLLTAFSARHDFGPNATDISFGLGGRLFQAARFVTEMEYQHLVFEEFARKVQPAVRPFHVYSPDINPAVDAEFAHAVYRFGHSMLDDDVARSGPDTNPDGTLVDHSLPLLTAFLNPPEFFDGHSAGTLTPQQAAGAIIMGSSDQVGNEIDEFTTEVLRNNLLGLPLDLPTLNMTRARSEGIPPLNEVRRKLFASTGDSQVAPYTDWSDFGNHLKHPESLINFVAAYGKHPTITGATTVAAKRAAARAIVDPFPGDPTATPPIPADVPPADAGDFMFGVGAWADVNGVSTTGLDDVDLWVGGLAEVTNLFGGLLGSTFNFVFQGQLEKLQDGDRFYYLNRTPGMNLRTQLEGNSFSEMIQRNTDGTNTLKADAFATADCKFQLANLAGTAAGFTASGAIVADDPTTDCNERLLLQRSPDGTIAYRQRNTVDTPGINGQAVYNGTAGVDRIKGGNDNDTVWGGAGNDVVDGQGGDDVVLGGEGNDIITDLDGADVPKGGPGNDAIDGGPGDDIPMGNEGQDFINGGANDNETFAGEGNDFVIAGQGADAVFGDGGDDWIEGGSGQDLLQGDHGAPFFDDPAETAPGNDIFVGQVGENDYDAEGGDDVMSQNAAIDRNAGAGGFDWAFHQYDTVGADDDMEINNNLVGLPIQVVVNRDRWQETEADSGSDFNDVIRGTSLAPATVGGAGFTGCNALDPAGVARIKGLDQLVTTFPSSLATVVANSAAGRCPLVGSGATPGQPNSGTVWGEGDILVGGKGSDTIEGRGADDVIDGDRYLTVAITVRDANGAETGRTDLMENKATSGTFGPGTTGMTLQQAVFAGLVDPGRLVAVRELVTPAVTVPDCQTTKLNCDTAVFSGPASNYSVVSVNGVVTVDQIGANVVGQKVDDGVDTLRNIEQLKFSDVTLPLAAVATVTPASLTFGPQRVGTTSAAQTVTVTSAGALPVTISAVTRAGTDASQFTAPAGCTGVTLTRGQSCTVSVAFAPTTAGAKTASLSIVNDGTTTPLTVGLTGTAVDVPGAPGIGTATLGSGGVTVRWTPPVSDGGSPVTGYLVRVVNAANAQVGPLRPAAAGATSLTIGGLTVGTTYRFQVQATNAVGSGAFSALSNPVTFATVPGAPLVVLATSGVAGGAVTANVLWTAPATGGSPITGYVVTVVNAANTVVLGTTTVGPAVRNLSPTIAVAAGTQVRFRVQAVNAVGTGAATLSNAVVAR